MLTGYEEPPAGVEVPDGSYYNAYFPGHMIAMPPPLERRQVTYADGTPATVDQMARDVVEFLAWAAEPKLEERKGMGIKVDPVPGRPHRPDLCAQAQDLGGRAALGQFGPFEQARRNRRACFASGPRMASEQWRAGQ